MIKGNFEVEILVNGHSVKEYYHNGRYYIQGNKGTRYTIKVRNNSSRRIVAIPTVDGLSAMDGEVATSGSRGYIINGYDSITIEGWRKSNQEVAEFYFSSLGESYAARSDKGGNQGVIGVAIFYEKRVETVDYQSLLDDYRGKIQKDNTWKPWEWNTTYTTGGQNFSVKSCTFDMPISFNAKMEKEVDSVRCLASQSFNQDSLGTGWGDIRRSEVTTVSFSHEDYPAEIFEIYYNSRENLREMGIDFEKRPLYMTSQAFPGGFCKPPRR